MTSGHGDVLAPTMKMSERALPRSSIGITHHNGAGVTTMASNGKEAGAMNPADPGTRDGAAAGSQVKSAVGAGRYRAQTSGRRPQDFDGTHDSNCSYPGGGRPAPRRFHRACAMRFTVLTLTPCAAAIARTLGRSSRRLLRTQSVRISRSVGIDRSCGVRTLRRVNR